VQQHSSFLGVIEVRPGGHKRAPSLRSWPPQLEALLPSHFDKSQLKRGGFVDDIDMFDSEFWSLSARDANSMDPQQRMCIEAVWEALEDAGIPPSSLAGGRHGVFLGVSSSDYSQLAMFCSGTAASDALMATGLPYCMNANKISYLLDLQGPSVVVDTACSSSAVAIHQACTSLRSGECETALAGGVNAILSPVTGAVLANSGAISPEGTATHSTREPTGT